MCSRSVEVLWEIWGRHYLRLSIPWDTTLDWAILGDIWFSVEKSIFFSASRKLPTSKFGLLLYFAIGFKRLSSKIFSKVFGKISIFSRQKSTTFLEANSRHLTFKSLKSYCKPNNNVAYWGQQMDYIF